MRHNVQWVRYHGSMVRRREGLPSTSDNILLRSCLSAMCQSIMITHHFPSSIKNQLTKNGKPYRESSGLLYLNGYSNSYAIVQEPPSETIRKFDVSDMTCQFNRKVHNNQPIGFLPGVFCGAVSRNYSRCTVLSSGVTKTTQGGLHKLSAQFCMCFQLALTNPPHKGKRTHAEHRM